MTVHTEVQTICDDRGLPAYAVLPMAQYEELLARARASKTRDEGLIPHDVVNAMFDGKGMSPARAWREHLGLTQTEVAARMGISQAALAQMESAARPRKASRERLAVALGIESAQLLV